MKLKQIRNVFIGKAIIFLLIFMAVVVEEKIICVADDGKEKLGAEKDINFKKYGDFNYKIYENFNFKYSFRYPSFLKLTYDENGEYIFENKERSVRLMTRGRFNNEKLTLDKYYSNDIKNIGEVYYKYIDRNYYFLSWNEGKSIFYKYKVVDHDITKEFLLEAPKEDREIFDSIINRMVNSFKGINIIIN